MAVPPPQPSWAAAHAQRRRQGGQPTGRRASRSRIPLRKIRQGSGWQVPVVMHVFHINKIVIISFSEVSIPATLSWSLAQTAQMQASLRHKRRPALCSGSTPSILLLDTSPCHERVFCTPAAFLGSLAGIEP